MMRNEQKNPRLFKEFQRNFKRKEMTTDFAVLQSAKSEQSQLFAPPFPFEQQLDELCKR